MGISFSQAVITNPHAGIPLGQTGAARFLNQATFGATLSSIAAAQGMTPQAWITSQCSMPATSSVTTMANATNTDTNQFFPAWMTMAVTAPDQLRQRVAFAFHEIMVASYNTGGLDDAHLGYYYDVLINGCLGNFYNLLYNVTLNLAMGVYLSMFRSESAAAIGGDAHADENYAREIMQLFSIGLEMLNQDGTLQLSGGQAIPTYVQATVTSMAKIFTGWGSVPVSHTGDQAFLFDEDPSHPMIPYADYHDTTAKTVLGPGGYTSTTNIPAGQTAQQDLNQMLGIIFNHPNVGPFIGKQLIQRLVTSNPSPGYVWRVAQAFNADSNGTRGNLQAVVTAILTDPEAMNPGGPGYGKLREPLIANMHLWRVFNAVSPGGDLFDYNTYINANQTYGEQPLNSSSVFNFFRPDYQPPGVLSNNGLAGPEFQITNENTMVLSSNLLQRNAYQYQNSAGTQFSEQGSVNAQTVLLFTAPWESLSVAQMVANFNLVFCANMMPASVVSALETYMSGISGAPWSQVAEGASLVMQSPHYLVQH